jgi:hypothetical protein
VICHEATRGQSLQEILTAWTLDELWDVNQVLNAIDGARARQVKEAERAGH